MNLSRIFTGVIFIVVLLGIMATTCPVVYDGDTGEVVAASYFLGIAHPPWYPLYTTLGHIFLYLPLYNKAFMVNIFATFLAAALFYSLLIKVADSLKIGSELTPFYALSSTLFLAFSISFWAQGVMAKGGVYHLNLIFIFLIITLFKLVLQRSDKSMLLWPDFKKERLYAKDITLLSKEQRKTL